MKIKLLNLVNTDLPPKIFFAGEIKPEDRRAVAIVGSRLMSSYGKKIASDFSFYLSSNGITIISGLARGIDTVVHESALKAKGRTIAVLGSGLDIVYPPENAKLFERIVKRGAVISQFPLGTKPYGKNFLARNRTIAALSLAVVVVEGKKKSGTLSTASHAADLGKEVFAVPGPITSPLAEAPNFLLENGARIAKSPKEVLEYVKSINLTK